MKTYYVHYHDNGAPRPIEGETIIDAVENNFRAIAEHAEIGNSAGYQLDKVVLEYQPEALGGKGGAALVITAHGSDALLHYDPRTDEPKTTTLWIDGVTPEELPEPDVTTFDGAQKKQQRTPYEDPESLAEAWGNVTAFLDQIGLHHCRTENVWPSVQTESAYHNLSRNNPFRYLEIMRQTVNRAHPNADAQTKKMLAQVDKLALYITDHTKEENAEAVQNVFLYQAIANNYLVAENKITALAYYRNKAGLSGRELGEKVGISDRQIRNYEHTPGSSLGDASRDVLQAISDVLNVNPSQLVDGGLAILVDPITGKES